MKPDLKKLVFTSTYMYNWHLIALIDQALIPRHVLFMFTVQRGQLWNAMEPL